MQALAESEFRFKYFPVAWYAMDITFQQTNVPTGACKEKKLYYSGKHSLYGHEVEVSVVTNGFAIDCTKFYKGNLQREHRLSPAQPGKENRRDDARSLGARRKSYDIMFQGCLALANVHVRLHPLRAEDGDANAQYINRLNAIGAKIIKTKRAAGKAYMSKRKVRLGMVLALENTFLVICLEATPNLALTMKREQ
ncbi:hypothetical protein DYB36_007554 [Aphanomyces astaci]|uniref:DDE Tnp4 domain-containing protein n=1 Tax=Aphanomyces astaci TaxID=112090 RepID=A0A397ABT0_APHAT|nr:hypothetical protein DYB36_007554 [Aphanomyces astaci]